MTTRNDAVQDLGVIEGPLLVFGGPYSNLQATRALLAEAKALGIPPGRLLCTGDVVAYCGEPAETVALIRESGAAVVMGNCEESLGADAEDCGCGFEKGSSCDLLSVQWYRFAVNALDRDAKAWMNALPRRIELTLGGRRFAAIHGGVKQIARFVFPGTATEVKAGELAEADAAGEAGVAGVDGVIGGHSGLPFSETIGGRPWHNAGVIGMPANDGTPRVWYSLLTPTGGGIAVEHRSLAYDHAGAVQAMHERGLPPDYAVALETGLWPSDEVMPEADRRRRGRAIEPWSMSFPRSSTVAA